MGIQAEVSVQKLLFVISFCGGLAACNSAPMGFEMVELEGADLTDESVFQSTITDFYGAELNRNWEQMWSYFPENLQLEMPFSEFRRNMADADEIVEFRFLEIENHGPAGESQGAISAQVEVTFERTELEGPNLYGINEGTDLWLKVDDIWYWGLRY